MDTINQNSTLRNLAIVLFAILIAFVAIKSYAEVKSLSFIGKSDSAPNVISVFGKGEVVATPDIAMFTFTVSEEAENVAAAQKGTSDKMNKILDYLKKSNVEDKDVKTLSYDIYPRYDYRYDKINYPSGKQVLAGYVASQTVQIKVRTLEKAGELLSGIGEFGASNVSGLSFTFDKQDDLVAQAREKAIADARVQAEKLAKSLGVELVGITSFYENTPYQPYPMAYGKGAADGVMMEQSANISLPQGESKIMSNVTISYQIK
jgi:uncharacterized protein YggE